MTKKELQYTLTMDAYLLRKGVRNAAYIYNMTDSNIEHICRFCKENNDIKFIIDPLDSQKVWLYKNEFVSVVIDSMYRMDYDAAQVMMGLLLGYSPNQEDIWLKYVREHKADYDYHSWGN